LDFLLKNWLERKNKAVFIPCFEDVIKHHRKKLKRIKIKLNIDIKVKTFYMKQNIEMQRQKQKKIDCIIFLTGNRFL
jgi:hypothetical protein